MEREGAKRNLHDNDLTIPCRTYIIIQLQHLLLECTTRISIVRSSSLVHACICDMSSAFPCGACNGDFPATRLYGVVEHDADIEVCYTSKTEATSSDENK